MLAEDQREKKRRLARWTEGGYRVATEGMRTHG